MKKYGILILALVVAASMTLLSCQAKEVEAQKWRIQHMNPAGSDEDKIVQTFAAAVAEDTNGVITLEVFPAASLGYAKADVADAVETGVLEIGHIAFSWIEGSSPIGGVTHLPGISATPEGIVKATVAVAPYVQKELAKRGMVNLSYYRNYNGGLYCNKPVRTIEDWKGLKLRAQGAAQEYYFAKAGATPVAMAKPEMYPGLAQGTIDGVLYSPSSSWSSKLHEVLGYYNLWQQPSVSFGFLIQKERLESLPKDIQDTIWKHAKVMEDAFWQQVFFSGPDYFKLFEAEGTEIVDVSLEEKQKLTEIAMGYWDVWLEKTGKEGLDALNAALKAGGQPAYK